MLNIAIESRPNVQIVRLEGRIDSATAKKLEDALLYLVDEGHKQLVADLANVKYVSSAGLRVFLIVAKRLEGADSALKLAAPNQTIKEVLELSGFLKLFEIVATA